LARSAGRHDRRRGPAAGCDPDEVIAVLVRFVLVRLGAAAYRDDLVAFIREDGLLIVTARRGELHRSAAGCWNLPDMPSLAFGPRDVRDRSAVRRPRRLELIAWPIEKLARRGGIAARRNVHHVEAV